MCMYVFWGIGFSAQNRDFIWRIKLLCFALEVKPSFLFSNEKLIYFSLNTQPGVRIFWSSL